MMCPFVLPFDITSNVTFKSLGKLRCDINIPENPADIVKEKPPKISNGTSCYTLTPSTREDVFTQKGTPTFCGRSSFFILFPTIEHGDVWVVPPTWDKSRWFLDSSLYECFGRRTTQISPFFQGQGTQDLTSCCSTALVKRHDADRFCVVLVFK